MKTLLAVLRSCEYDRIDIDKDLITFWGKRNNQDIEGWLVESTTHHIFYSKVFDGYKIILMERK